MQTDRELIENAARALGWKWNQGIAEKRAELGVLGLWIMPADGSLGSTAWNPLEDSAAALHLAVKLDLFTGPAFWHEQATAYAFAAMQGDRQDPVAATRRAIVRAAASLATQTPAQTPKEDA